MMRNTPNYIADFDLSNLPPIEQIKEIKKVGKAAIHGEEAWENIRMNPTYHDYWKVVDYYMERNSRIIVMNGHISHNHDPNMVGNILWSEGGDSWSLLNRYTTDSGNNGTH